MELSHLDMLCRLGLAIVAGGIIGFERERHRHPAGLRTHILVCVSAAIIAMMDCITAQRAVELGNPSVTSTLGRISAQVVSGIGFLGAGTIITTKRNIAGLTTAASLWLSAGLGLAAGLGEYELCLMGSVCAVVVLTLVKRLIVGHSHKVLEVSYVEREETFAFLKAYLGESNIHIRNMDFRMEENSGQIIYTNTYMLDIPSYVDESAIINDIAENHNIRKVRTRNP